MKSIQGSEIAGDVREALIAYLQALTLAEPVLSALWQQSRLTLSQLIVLRALREGPQPAGRLAETVGLSSASATRLIDRLEARDLIERRRDQADRRCVQVHLTAEGRALLGAVRVLVGSPLHRAVEAMSPDERQELLHSLTALVNRAREATAPLAEVGR